MKLSEYATVVKQSGYAKKKLAEEPIETDENRALAVKHKDQR